MSKFQTQQELTGGAMKYIYVAVIKAWQEPDIIVAAFSTQELAEAYITKEEISDCIVESVSFDEE